MQSPEPLLGQYEKYPEFIEIELKPQDLSCLVNSQTKHALYEVLDQKTRELIILKSFPIVLRIFLVPELNILTIKSSSKTEVTIDQLLTNLLSVNDEGKNLKFRESYSIISGSDERVYKWLHSFAGLHLKATSNNQLVDRVQYLTGVVNEPSIATRDVLTAVV